MSSVPAEAFAEFNHILNVHIQDLIGEFLLPILKSPGSSMVGPPISVDSTHSMSRCDEFFTLKLLNLVFISCGNKLKTIFHQSKEVWVVNVLSCHMIKNIGSLVHWHLCFTSTHNFVNIYLDSTIQVDSIVVEEKWVLSIISMLGSLDVPSSFTVDVRVVKPSWLEVMSSASVPHWVREHTELLEDYWRLFSKLSESR